MELYYYTTTEVMRYILSNGNIYATNLRYMNDSEEYVNGLRELREMLITRESDFHMPAIEDLKSEDYEESIYNRIDSFSISFTTARDLLSQWAIYAKESGVSLTMEFPINSEMSFDTYNVDNVLIEDNYLLSPQKVEYFTKEVLTKEKYEEEIEIILQRMNQMVKTEGIKSIEDNIVYIWKNMAPYIKRADFGAEEEYRLVFNYAKSQKDNPRIDFRNDRNVLKPYIDVYRKEGWPIKEIIVGPGFNQNAVFESIVYFLQKARIKARPISKEDIIKRIQEYFVEMKRQCDSESDIEKIVAEWKQKEEDSMKTTEKKESSIVNNIYEEFQSFIKDHYALQKNEKIRSYINQNFLSKNGIICRKSKIPYLF